MVSDIQRTKPNRFSGGCKVNLNSENQQNGKDDKEYVKDVTWNPNTKVMVIEKNNKKDLTIDIGKAIGDVNSVDEDIKVLIWNPTSEQYVSSTLVKKGTDYTDAMQKIVAAISSDNGVPFKNNVQKMIDDQRVKDQKSGFFMRWRDWEDEEEQG